MSKVKAIYDLMRIRYIVFLNMPIILSALILSGNFNFKLIFFICISYFFAHFFVDAVNDLYDLDTDRIHPVKSRENPVTSGKLSFKEAKFIVAILPFLAILLAIPTNLIWFFAILFYIFLGWSYSMPPFRTRAKPWGFLTNETLGSSLAFVWTYWAAKPPQTNWPSWILPITLFIFFSHALNVCKDLPDIEPDRKVGFRNFSIAYGIKTTKRVVILSTLISFFIYIYLFVTHVFSIVALPFAVIGVFLPLRGLSKPTGQITDRRLIYQEVIPASLFYSIALILGVLGRLFIPW